MAGCEAVTPLESEIRMLADGLRSIRDEQAYMMARERTHQASGFLAWGNRGSC